MKRLFPLLIIAFVALFAISCGEDRSGEQPFAPTVQTVSVFVEADKALMTGNVTASPNSSLLECGFVFGNDTLRSTVICGELAETFTAEVDSMKAGNYFMSAFAKNGVGTSYGDTLYFTIE